MAPLIFIAAAVFATVFVASLRNLRRTIRTSTEATSELALHMQVAIPSAGPKEIYLTGPRGVVTWGLWFSLLDPGGNPVPLKRILIPFGWSGQDANVGIAKCEVPQGGLYSLQATMIPKSTRPMYVRICKPLSLTASIWLLVLVISALLSCGSLAVAIVLSRS